VQQPHTHLPLTIGGGGEGEPEWQLVSKRKKWHHLP
jgi:hypothetical protein